MNIVTIVYKLTPDGDVLMDIVAPKNGSYVILDHNVYVRGWNGLQPKPYLVAKIIHSVVCSLQQWTGEKWDWLECVICHPTVRVALSEKMGDCDNGLMEW